MLLVCRTPPRSDRLDAPERSRLMVVGLFPKGFKEGKRKIAVLVLILLALVMML
jgi:hypothetical protein